MRFTTIWLIISAVAAAQGTRYGGENWKAFGKMGRYPRGLSFPKLDEGWVVGTGGSILHYHLVALAGGK